MRAARVRPVFAVLIACVGTVGVARAGTDAYGWLMKIDQAARTRNFDGIFVYQHGDKLETMRIVHRVDNGRVMERLVSLNGVPREIIRTDREVQCFLPDENSVVVEHRKAEANGFPSILPQQLSELKNNYTIELGRSGRVAGRDSQLIVIRPKDGYRYGYELWADKVTGLLLRADLVDMTGKAVEQFMFTQIQPDAPIALADLRPHFANKNSIWHRANDDDEIVSSSPGWAPAQLPAGFKLSTRIMRKMPTRKQPVEHLVYSDGLAAVSIFVERLPARTEGAKPAVSAANHVGAVNAFVKVVDNHQITVVGEVPAATVNAIGESVKPLP